MKKYFLFIISFVTNFCFAQVPSIEWQKSLGGSNNDWGTSIQQTKDGGYIVGGYSMSFDEDVTGHHSSDDFWVARLNPSGDLIWQKSLGGTLDDNAYSIKETADKGFIIAGSTGCTDGDVTYNHGYSDYWVVKLDSSGNIQWQKTYGGSLYETALCIEQTKDLGFIISGHSDSNDGDVTNAHSGDDCWIVKTDSYGVIQWQKTYGGSNDDWAWSIQQTTDNGYIVAGASNSNNGDVTGHHGSVSYGDCWVFKTDSLGNLLWEKSIGGSFNEDFKSVQQTSDGGYILAGSTQSSDGDVTGFKGATDIWVAKLDANGNLVGKRTFGGSDSDQGYSVKQTNDKGFIVTGCTNSSDGDVTNKRGTASYSDYWVVKIDTMGAIEW
ncbi:MAG: T9SS type A sorting domain-containing protein, partial [Bacteroidia bacterium]